MKRAWLVLMVATACEAEEDRKDYPVDPGGPGGGGGGVADAATGDGDDGGAALVGRVCLLTDLRALTSCAGSGAGGLTVTLGSETAETTDSGAFTIVRATGANLVWRVTGAAITPSVMKLGASTSIPVIGADAYVSLQNDNGLVVNPGQGSIVVRVERAGAAVPGAIVSAAPLAQYPTLYDGDSAFLWEQDATGGFGVAWLPGAVLGAATLTVTPPTGEPVAAVVPVEDAAITFAAIELP